MRFYKVAGNIWSDDGLVQMLENGATGTGAWFRGDINSDDGTKILDSGTDGSDAWVQGDVYSDNGVVCLVNGATPDLATFTGTATWG
jgi:hypothetical protein